MSLALVQPSITGLERDLQLSLKPVLVALLIASIILFFVSDALPPSATQWRLQLAVLLLLMTSIIAWLLDGWKPYVGRWFTIMALAVLIYWGSGWPGTYEFLALVGIPTALAAALGGLPAASVTALGETALVLLRSTPTDADPIRTAQPIALIAIWATLGIIWAIYRTVHQLGRWVWQYLHQAQTALEEARDSKAELAQTLDDLAYANRQLALTNERLAALSLIAEEAQRAKTAFVSKVSHEFRTPLNMIIGLIDLLVETPEVYGQDLPAALFEDLEIVHRNCEHLSSLINDVLDLSQAEAGRLTLHREQVNLAEIVDDAVRVVRPLLDRKRLSLQIEIADDLPTVYCDQTRIRQVVLNLVSNAARFTDEGRITVKAAQQDGYAVISVEDTGPGIPPEDTEKIFEPFCQSTGELWRATGGSGLGLSISKQFVELHGGRIWFDSRPGVGTTFSFSLPITEPMPHLARAGHWIKEDWVWTERLSRFRFPDSHYRPRVIICDETGGFGCAPMHHLDGAPSDGIELVQVESPAQAVQKLQQGQAHAVILNAASPDALWQEVTRAGSTLRGTPVIGCSIPSRIEHAMQAGAVDYLIKPVKRADLERAVRQDGKPASRVLVVDDDPDILRLWTRMLLACEGIQEVIAASSGKEALAKARLYLPDVILLDILMPNMDGWQVLKAINQDETTSHIPVVLISAQDPVERPPTSAALLLAIGDKLSPSWILRCSLEISALLLNPDREPAQVPAETADVARVSANRGQPLGPTLVPLP
jgi:signal transduction histidine kinase/CheY-like chemotaxis protein